MAGANIKLSVTGGGAAKQEVSALSNALKEATGSAKAFGKALPGGGTAMNVLGLNGPMAFAATVGAIIANSIRLAIEFNRISSASTWQMTSNAAQAMSTLRAFQRQAMSMSDLGLSGNDAARMMAGYGSSSGSMSGIYQGRSLAMYARAMGQDPTAFASQMGLLGQNAGPNIGRTAGNIMGAAAISGDAGRRIPEFIGVATAVLQQIASGNPGKNVDIRDALKEVTGFTHLGGYFATSQGLQTSLSGFNKFGGSLLGNYQAQAIGRSAGFGIEDIILGANTPQKKAAFANAMFKRFGGDRPNTELFMQSMGMGSEEIRGLMKAHELNGGKWLDSDFKKIDAKSKADAFANSDAGQIAKMAAEIENAQINMGTTLIHAFAPFFERMANGIEALGPVPTLLGAILAATLVSGGGGLLSKLIGAGGGGLPSALRLLGPAGLAIAGGSLLVSGGNIHDRFNPLDGIKDPQARDIAAHGGAWWNRGARAEAVSDLMDPTKTTTTLARAIAAADRNGYELLPGYANTGHHPDGIHSVGRALDVWGVRGSSDFDNKKSENESIRTFLRWALHSHLYNEIGVPKGSAYLADPELQKMAHDNGTRLFGDAPGHIHLEVAGGTLDIKHTVSFKPKTRSNVKGGTHRSGR